MGTRLASSEDSPRSVGTALSADSQIDRVVRSQFLATISAAIILLVIDWVAAYSAFLGGMSSALPGMLAVWRLRRAEANGFAGVLQSELWKFAGSAAMFIAVFVLVKPLNAGYFFGAFIAVHLLYAVIPVLQARRLRRVEPKQATPEQPGSNLDR